MQRCWVDDPEQRPTFEEVRFAGGWQLEVVVHCVWEGGRGRGVDEPDQRPTFEEVRFAGW